MKPKKLREVLAEKLTKKEMEHITTSFDIVGNIAVMEIKPEVEHKEKEIGKSILEMHKNIETVCKRAGIHSGIYRTQKLKVIAGKRKKETIHKESGCSLKLNIEKCYFSARSGTERLRIAEQIKKENKKTGKKEDILVMFSGIAPFVCVIAKNSPYNIITGIEINQTAHEYAVENIKINKIKNANIYQGDVRDLIPNITKRDIALKSWWIEKEMKSRIAEKPQTIEFFMKNEDLVSNQKEINKAVKRYKNYNIMMHLPHKFKSKSTSLGKKDSKESIECIKKAYDIVKNNNNIIGFIVHSINEMHDKGPYKKEWLIKNINSLGDKILDYLYLENSTIDPFATKKSILDIIKKSKLKHMCFDYAHYLIKNKEITPKDISEINNNIDTYYHIVNHNPDSGEHCSRLREGKIDFKNYFPYMKKGCVEVCSKNEITGDEQIEDWKYYNNIIPKKFDRIIMPLPRTAEEFLDTALLVAKKNTMIHLYGFLSEEEIDDYKKKIKQICKENNKEADIKQVVKCGQFSPKVYRICVDFKITS